MYRHVFQIFALACLAACGGGGSGGGDPNTSPPPDNPPSPTVTAPAIAAQPGDVTVSTGETATFSVTATGTPPLGYQWSHNGVPISGATSSSYTTAATALPDNGATFRVTVSNTAGSVASLAAVLTVQAPPPPPPPPPLLIGTASLPGGVVNTSYSATVQASGGTPPYTWAVTSGALPAGLALSSTTGTISGTPTAAGVATFGVTAADAADETASTTLAITITPEPAVGPPFGHIAIVVLENHDYADVVDNTTDMPYFNSLMDEYGLATEYYGNTHPSIGDYFMLTTGQILTNNDGKTPDNFPVSVDNVVRQLLAHGKTWKSYAEDLPSVGYTGGNTGLYVVRHNPLAYFTDVKDDPLQKQNLVPLTQFATDIAAAALPHYSFVVPNNCNNGHNCGLNVVDTWLSTNIQPLIDSTPFRDDGLLIIVFDEASNDDDLFGGGRIAAVFISPAFSKAGYQSTTFYQHESALRLTLEGLGIDALPGASATAPAMWEFFTFPPP